MLPSKKQYAVHYVTVREYDGETLALVLIPWAHYRNQLSATAYGSLLQRAGVIAIIASMSPTDGLVYYETSFEQTLKAFLAKNPIGSLHLEAMMIEDTDGWIAVIEKGE